MRSDRNKSTIMGKVRVDLVLVQIFSRFRLLREKLWASVTFRHGIESAHHKMSWILGLSSGISHLDNKRRYKNWSSLYWESKHRRASPSRTTWGSHRKGRSYNGSSLAGSKIRFGKYAEIDCRAPRNEYLRLKPFLDNRKPGWYWNHFSPKILNVMSNWKALKITMFYLSIPPITWNRR